MDLFFYKSIYIHDNMNILEKYDKNILFLLN